MESRESGHDDHKRCGAGKLSKAEFAAAKEKIAADGPAYWRSLQELAGDPEFQERLHREFPKGASEWLAPLSRRDFLSLMGASIALAGMTACVKQPIEQIVPYVVQPNNVVPGKAKFYATAMPFGGYGIPLLAESHMGRPTKIEGNPQHAASLGGSDIFSQASILELYDPDRSQAVTFNGKIEAWYSFLASMRSALAAAPNQQIRILTQSVSSPTLTAQIQNILKKFPNARWHTWEPVNRDSARAGAQTAFGELVEPRYHLEKADVVLSVDADFLYPTFPGFHRYTRNWANRRRPHPERRPFADIAGNLMPDAPMNRLYMLESTPTSTGAKADHCLKITPHTMQKYLHILAAGVGTGSAVTSAENDAHTKWLDTAVLDLKQHRGRGLVLVGDHMPPEAHALAHFINGSLGNIGETVVLTDSVLTSPPNQGESLKALVAEMNSGNVDLLLIVGGNPVYDAPADLGFAEALAKVRTSVHHGLHLNETGAKCNWHVNATHYLEHWSDVRAYDGTCTLVQPLIAPLYGGKSEHELLDIFDDAPQTSGYDIVRSYWQANTTNGDFEAFWRQSLFDGFIAGSAFTPRSVKPKAAAGTPSLPPEGNGMELIIRPDPSIYDGRFANNAWLQELPKPLTELTWDNPVMIGHKMAQRLGLENGSVVELEFKGRKVVGATWIQPGHPDNAATVFLGYGRDRAGRSGDGLGYNAYKLRTSDGLPGGVGLNLRKTGGRYKLISAQGLQDMEGRDLVREATIAEYEADSEFAHRNVDEPSRALTLYPNYEYTGYAWGMTIDQNACVGCNACVIACQSENNVPVVGKLQVAMGRRMHWLRVDTYYKGDPDHPDASFQPVPCMQCENAPCELVCPVQATVHSTEGLNDMIYNRCVGTRYCSNNCPYKVRRFNFLLFQDWVQPQFKMMRNPDVSVRSRGVMEKCTYCVQRITHGRIRAEEEKRLVRDNEVLTACQQACPADAIVFGNINDKNSRVAKLKENPRNYGLLADMNTRPRTTYLAMVHNPNPAIPELAEHHETDPLKARPPH